MAQTTRIGPVDYASPYLRFFAGADWVGQSQSGNYSVLRTSITNETAPGGSSATNTGGYGLHYMWWGGGWLSSYSANPFAPSGYPVGARRWDVTNDHNFAHDGAGNLGSIAFGMHVEYPGVNNDYYGSIPGPARIPKRPSPPGAPAVSNLLPNSVTLSWTASADNGGSGVDTYLLRRWPGTPSNPGATGGYTDISSANNLSRTDSTIQPGQTYTYAVYAHNGSADNGGYSNVSAHTVVSALSGAYVSDGTSWVPTGVFESDGSNWLTRVIQTSNGSAWQDAL